MSGFQAAFDPDDISVYMKNEQFAETFIEMGTMQPMVNDLNELQELPRAIKDGQETQTEVEKLCRKYPFLESTKEEPALGNPYWELKARLRVWGEALDFLRYLPEAEEKRQDMKAFWEFECKFSVGEYEFLWEQPYIAPQKGYLLHYYAYDAFWTFIQNMKHKELTASQEQDWQRLERWIALEIKDTLIQYELSPMYGSSGELEWDFDEEDIKLAVGIVERRIAKGDWQIPRTAQFQLQRNLV